MYVHTSRDHRPGFPQGNRCWSTCDTLTITSKSESLELVAGLVVGGERYVVITALLGSGPLALAARDCVSV